MVSDKLFDRACNDLQVQTKKVFELVQTHNALLASHATLVEAVAWERECVWLWEYGPAQRSTADDEIIMSMVAARDEVDRLLEEK